MGNLGSNPSVVVQPGPRDASSETVTCRLTRMDVADALPDRTKPRTISQGLKNDRDNNE